MKKKLFLGIGLLIILGGFLVFKFNSRNKNDNQVDTIRLSKSQIESQIRSMGKISSMDKRDVTSDVEEKISKLYVKKGDIVKKGQVLMELDRTNINYKIREAEARLNMDKEELNKLNTKGDLDLELSLSNAKIKYNDSKKEYERNKFLYEEGAIDKVSLDRSKDAMDESYNDYLLAEDRLRSSSLSSEIAIQKERLRISEIDLAKIKDDLSKYTIKSPISGTIVGLDISEEGIVESHKVLMSIQDISNLELDLELSEFDALNIKEGSIVEISSDAVEGMVYKGKIKSIDQIAKQSEGGSSSVFHVKSSIENIDSNLKSGLNMKANILVDKKDNIYKVPYEAIKQNQKGQEVIYIVSNGVIEEIPVDLGLKGDFDIEIVGDLKEGMEVILSPEDSLMVGDEVVIRGGDEDDRN